MACDKRFKYWHCEGFRPMLFDLENDPDVLAMVAASAALVLSGAPFMGPIAAARVGFVNGAYVLNPKQDQLPTSQLELVVAGTAEHRHGRHGTVGLPPTRTPWAVAGRAAATAAAPPGAASSSGKGSATETIFSPSTSPSPQAMKPWTNEKGLTAQRESSSASV